MLNGIPDVASAFAADVVDVQSVDDHVPHKLDGEAGSVGDVDVRSPAVDRLVTGDQQLLLQVDYHAPCEYDPQWLLLDHRMTESPGLRVQEIPVGCIVHDVVPPLGSPSGLLAEAQRAFCQSLALSRPVFLAPPAPVDWVLGDARPGVLAQLPSRGVRPLKSPASRLRT